MGNIVVHFEIYVDDIARAKRFYTDVLGWAFQDMGEKMGNYVLVFPSGEIEQGPAKVGVNGGMLLRPGPKPQDDTAAPSAFVCTVAVDDIAATVAKVEAAGGRVDMPIGDVPGVGQLAYVRDTELNLVGLLQPNMQTADGESN